MKQESLAFTAADVPRFFDEILLYEMQKVAARLRAAGERLDRLVAAIPDARGEGVEWSAKEVLAHIAVLSRAYGVFAYMVATGRLTELEIANVISQRDVVGEEMAGQPVADIVAEIHRQHDRTLAFLDRATTDQLKAHLRTENGTITVEYLLRFPLLAHLELHLDQLEGVLGPGPA
jgi:hypothetical protein